MSAAGQALGLCASDKERLEAWPAADKLFTLYSLHNLLFTLYCDSGCVLADALKSLLLAELVLIQHSWTALCQ